MSVKIDTYCGLSCDNCEFKISENCGGCIETKGNPFHGTCEIAECAKAKDRHFCGDCNGFPCEILTRYSYDPQHGDGGARIDNCRKLKERLVEESK